jgi:excisionase family DNA binding protein
MLLAGHRPRATGSQPWVRSYINQLTHERHGRNLSGVVKREAVDRTREPRTSLDELPDSLTVEEAAAVLRISRGKAYELARVWRAEGLPVLVFGRSLRVPREGLRQLLTSGIRRPVA